MPSLAEPALETLPAAPSAKKLGKRKALPSNPLPRTNFNTLERERQFRHPSKTESHYKAAHELIRPHLESFNALFEGENGGRGLLDLAVKDLEQKVVFDQKDGKGNKLISQSLSIETSYSDGGLICNAVYSSSG